MSLTTLICFCVEGRSPPAEKNLKTFFMHTRKSKSHSKTWQKKLLNCIRLNECVRNWTHNWLINGSKPDEMSFLWKYSWALKIFLLRFYFAIILHTILRKGPIQLAAIAYSMSILSSILTFFPSLDLASHSLRRWPDYMQSETLFPIHFTTVYNLLIYQIISIETPAQHP